MPPVDTEAGQPVRIELQVGREKTERLVCSDDVPKASVVLVRPALMFAERAIGNEIVPSIGLAYINGYLRKFGYEPALVDGQSEGHNTVRDLPGYPGYQIQGLTIAEILALLPTHIDIVGITAMFSAEWPLARDLINSIKEKHPQAIIVAGGEHISATPEYSLRDCKGLDYCVCGEGEQPFLELCEAVTHGQAVRGLPGIAYLDDDKVFQFGSGVTRIRNIDVIPWPYWPEGYLEKFWESGKSFGVQTARDMPLMTTRGCPYRCTFCSNNDMWTTRYVMRDIDDIIREVSYCYEKYQVTSFQIYDLTAITKKNWFMELLRRIEQLHLPVEWSFPSGTRSEVLDDEILQLLKKVGTSYICYAPESGSPRTLENIKKQADLGKMMDSIKAANRAGLTVRANFIIGFPCETRADIMQTLWMALKCTYYGVQDLQPYIFNPYPGSELFAQCIASKDIVLSDDYYLSISRQNSDLLNLKPVTFNRNMPNWELALYRIVMTLVCYLLGYLLYPSRILRTIKNLWNGDRADTVLEARLLGIMRRKKEQVG